MNYNSSSTNEEVTAFLNNQSLSRKILNDTKTLSSHSHSLSTAAPPTLSVTTSGANVTRSVSTGKMHLGRRRSSHINEGVQAAIRASAAAGGAVLFAKLDVHKHHQYQYQQQQQQQIYQISSYAEGIISPPQLSGSTSLSASITSRSTYKAVEPLQFESTSSGTSSSSFSSPPSLQQISNTNERISATVEEDESNSSQPASPPLRGVAGENGETYEEEEEGEGETNKEEEEENVEISITSSRRTSSSSSFVSNRLPTLSLPQQISGNSVVSNLKPPTLLFEPAQQQDKPASAASILTRRGHHQHNTLSTSSRVVPSTSLSTAENSSSFLSLNPPLLVGTAKENNPRKSHLSPSFEAHQQRQQPHLQHLSPRFTHQENTHQDQEVSIQSLSSSVSVLKPMRSRISLPPSSSSSSSSVQPQPQPLLFPQETHSSHVSSRPATSPQSPAFAIEKKYANNLGVSLSDRVNRGSTSSSSSSSSSISARGASSLDDIASGDVSSWLVMSPELSSSSSSSSPRNPVTRASSSSTGTSSGLTKTSSTGVTSSTSSSNNNLLLLSSRIEEMNMKTNAFKTDVDSFIKDLSVKHQPYHRQHHHHHQSNLPQPQPQPHQQQQQQRLYNLQQRSPESDSNVVIIRVPPSSSSGSRRSSSVSTINRRFNVDDVEYSHNTHSVVSSSPFPSLPPPPPSRRSPERSERLPGVSAVTTEMLPAESLRRSLALSANEQLMKRRKETDAFNWAHHGWKGQVKRKEVPQLAAASAARNKKVVSPRRGSSFSSTASSTSTMMMNEEEPPSADGRYGLPWELAHAAVDSLKRVASFQFE
jgi:hypothetical protein